MVYQTVNTIGGLLTPGTYAVSFYQAGGQWNRYEGASTTQWEVGLGSTCLLSCGNSASFVGQIQLSQAMVNSPGGNGATGTFVPWALQTLYFTIPSSAGSSAPQILSFVPIGNIGVPPAVFLDGVDLVAAVPEPMTLLMMGVALLGLSIVGLRRRRQARPERHGIDTVPTPAT